jgi:hypothetical protein
VKITPETDSTPSIYYKKVSIAKHKTSELSHISGDASGGGGQRKESGHISEFFG